MIRHSAQRSGWLRIAVGLFVFLFSCEAGAQSRDEYLSLGQKYARLEQWKEAEENLRIYRQANPNSIEAAVLHARALIRLNQPFDAVLELEELLQNAPDAVPVLKLYAGLLDAVVNDEAKAEEVLIRCARLAPDDLEVWTALGHHYLARGKSADAIRSFEQAVRLAPGDASLLAGLAAGYGQANLTEQAERMFARALKLNDQNPKPDAQVYLRYADYLSKAGRFAESLPVFTKALALDARSSDAYYGRANAHEKLKDFKRAGADALAAIRESPQRKDAYQLVLRIHRAANDQERVAEYAAAIEKLAAEENAQHALARDLRAALRQAEPLLREAKFVEAAPHYEEIIRLLPTFYEAYFALGICYSQTGRSDQAEASFKKYLSFQPLSADGHASLGLLLLQRGRNQEARDELERAVKLDQSLEEARKGLARVYTLSGDYAAARSELNQVLSADPHAEPEVYVMLATAEFNLKDKARALAASERGLKSHPDAAALEDFHASLLVDCGTTLECRQKLAESLRRKPNSPAYLKAIAKLLLREDPRNAQAEEMLARIVRALPRDAEARYLFAQWAHLNNKFQLSLEELNGALALRSVDDHIRMQIHALTGMVQESLNDARGAEQAYQNSLEINRKLSSPSQPAAFRYVEFLVKQRRGTDAQKVAEEILKWDSSFAPARLERAKFLAKQGKTAEAIAEGKLALQSSEGDQDQSRAAHAFLAKTYFAAGQVKEAQTHQSWIEAHSTPQP